MFTLDCMALLQRVLILDQIQNIESLIQRGLLNYPVDMMFCSTQKEALVAFHRTPPDLLVAGLVYSDGDAVSLIDVLQKRFALTPSLFIDDPAYVQYKSVVQRRGAFDWIPDPVDIALLHRKMEQTLHVTKAYRLVTRLQQFVPDDPSVQEYHTWMEESKQRGVPVAQVIAEGGRRGGGDDPH